MRDSKSFRPVLLEGFPNVALLKLPPATLYGDDVYLAGVGSGPLDGKRRAHSRALLSSIAFDANQLHSPRGAALDGHGSLAAGEVLGDQGNQFFVGFSIDGRRLELGKPHTRACFFQVAHARTRLYLHLNDLGRARGCGQCTLHCRLNGIDTLCTLTWNQGGARFCAVPFERRVIKGPPQIEEKSFCRGMLCMASHTKYR